MILALVDRVKKINHNNLATLGRVLGIAMVVYIIDRVSKIVLLQALTDGRSLKIIPDFFHLTLVMNTGAAFGLMKDQRLFFLTLSSLVIIFILAYAVRHHTMSLWATLGLGLVLGGAVGNMIDRIRFGCVIDFLDFRIWPVFNLADTSITIGAAILFACTLFTNNKQG